MTTVDTTTTPTYEIEVTPLKGRSKREDWHVIDADDSYPVSFAATEIVDKLRQFFDQLEAEAEARKDDPIAMVHALARMEALLADVRYVKDSIQRYAAESLDAANVRRMTIEHIATVEAANASERRNWEHARALSAMLRAAHLAVLDQETGELMDDETAAALLLDWFTPSWKMNGMRGVGLNPDDYSEQPKGEDGKPMKKPSVRFHDNKLRRP